MNARADLLAKLYETVGRDVWHFALRSTRDPQEAQDVLQETFYIAAKNLDRVLAARSQRAWLIGIALNVVRQQRRARRPSSMVNEPVAPTDAPEDSRLDAMRTAIRSLDAPSQEVLRLRLNDELSYAEIAEVLDIPVGTVRSRLHTAVSRLRMWAADFSNHDPAHSVPRPKLQENAR